RVQHLAVEAALNAVVNSFIDVLYAAGTISKPRVRAIYTTVIIPPGLRAGLQVAVLTIHTVGYLEHRSRWSEITRRVGNQLPPVCDELAGIRGNIDFFHTRCGPHRGLYRAPIGRASSRERVGRAG